MVGGGGENLVRVRLGIPVGCPAVVGSGGSALCANRRCLTMAMLCCMCCECLAWEKDMIRISGGSAVACRAAGGERSLFDVYLEAHWFDAKIYLAKTRAGQNIDKNFLPKYWQVLCQVSYFFLFQAMEPNQSDS